MDNPNTYYKDALKQAETLAESDKRFRVNYQRQHRQGNKNRVVCGFFDDQPVIYKVFDDRIRPGAQRRKDIEVFFLRHASGSGVTPGLLKEFPSAILMEEFPGRPLEELITDPAPGWIESVGEEMGEGYARMAFVGLSPDAICEYQNAFAEGRDLLTQTEEVLDSAEAYCKNFLLAGIEEKFSFVRGFLSRIDNEPRTLFKYDNNLGNVIVDNGRLSGFIDFEECFVGTPSIFLGAVFDCLHKLPWDAQELRISQCPSWDSIRKGWESATGQNIDMNIVVAMGLLNAFRRINFTANHVKGPEFWGPRHRLRINTLWSYL